MKRFTTVILATAAALCALRGAATADVMQPAGSSDQPPFAGTFFSSLTSRSAFRTYTGYLAGQGPASEANPANWVAATPLTPYTDPDTQLDYYAAPGAVGGETAWSVFQLAVVYGGQRTGPNTISETAAENRLWLSGDGGMEIAGISHGRQDDSVAFNDIDPLDPFNPIADPARWQQSILSSGDQYKVWHQDAGDYDAAIAAGPSGRTGADSYAGIGDGLDPVLMGYSVAGDQTGEILSLYIPAADGVGGNGHFNTYIYLDDGTWQPTENESFGLIFPFMGAGGTDAHLRLRTTINPATGPAGWQGVGFGPLTGEAIPEPTTLALLVGPGLLLMFRRRRRRRRVLVRE